MAQLESFLNDTDFNQRTSGSTASGNGHNNIVTGTGTISSHSVQSFQTAQTGRSLNSDANQEGLRRRGNGHTRISYEDLSMSKAWILPIFHYERYGTKVKHLSVDPADMSDETFFTMVKERYLEETSRIRRFFSLRGVKKISYVKVCCCASSSHTDPQVLSPKLSLGLRRLCDSPSDII